MTNINIKNDYSAGREFVAIEKEIALDNTDSIVLNNDSEKLKVNSDKEKSLWLYQELDEINAILSDPLATEEQIVNALEKYSKLINDNKNIKLMSEKGNLLAEKAREINDEIRDYLIRKDMVTFGYFVEKMDSASKYAHDISLRYHRESMNNYMNFYQDVTAKLNSFGNHIGDTIDDGKQNLVSKREFYNELYNEMKKYFYYGDGEGYILYENNIEIIKVGDDKFDVKIGGELVESNISYKAAYGRLEYFFSSHIPVISGTKLCKFLNPIKDKDGNLCGIEGKVEQFLFPSELYEFMGFNKYESELDDINKNFDGDIELVSKWENVPDEMTSSAKDRAYTKDILKKNYDAGIENYYGNDKRKVKSEMYQHQINTINTRIDGSKKSIQITLDEYSQRYNTINSNYDNMLRTIATMISELTQELKGFLRF